MSQSPDLSFILDLDFVALIHSVNFLLLELLDKLSLLLVLLLRLLRQVLDLLLEEGLLLVKFRLTCLLHAGNLFLFLQRLIHLICYLLFIPGVIPTELVELVLGFQLNPLSLFERLGQTLASSLFSCSQLSFLLLHVPQLRVEKVIIFPLLFLHLRQVLLQLRLSLLS